MGNKPRSPKFPGVPRSDCSASSPEPNATLASTSMSQAVPCNDTADSMSSPETCLVPTVAKQIPPAESSEATEQTMLTCAPLPREIKQAFQFSQRAFEYMEEHKYHEALQLFTQALRLYHKNRDCLRSRRGGGWR
eukprot:g75669.t1